MKNKSLKVDGWRYHAHVDDLSQLHLGVESPFHDAPPSSLFRLSGVSKWSVDALENSYLYGSHPWQFNDLFDCHKNLVLSDCPDSRTIILNFMKEAYESELDELTTQQLEERIHESRTDLAYTSFGLVCMTPIPDNVLMWAYYGNNSGFMTEYDYTLFPGNFYGPYPINYQTEIKPISLNEHGDRVATLYQSLVKSDRWRHEKEWRFLCMSDNGQALLPFGVNPEIVKHGHDRKFKYPEQAVKSVTLGNRFFDIEQMTALDDELFVEFKNNSDNRKNILDIVIKRGIDIQIAMQQNDLMHLSFKECRLEQIDDLHYRFISPNKK